MWRVTCAVELATLVREDGVTKIRTLTADQVTAVIKKHEDEEQKAEQEKKQTAAAASKS